MIKNNSVENRWILLLLLFYFFGFLGIAIPEYRDFFLPLTPLNLLLTFVVFYKVNKDFSQRFVILSLLVFLIGFSVESIGVATGVLFGSYSYGNSFGFKLFETPVMIGVNWLFLAFSTYGIVQFFTKKALWLIFIPPLLMTTLDFLVEPVAMKLSFWSWENDIIPMQNYAMWFITSIAIHGLIYLLRPKINAKISFIIIGVQVLFFGFLNIFL
ncbi:carotenoid biosynthesis protein [uncultured Polaribacter sp.]|uniref:carotenoid biosynthesis protein n=1 Tax=uncultured Polaribacter sp. TaxID=174711 RepID=UPI002607F10A|nr:carotenoid biosynthesis protein [uncultured Polaribacter sp.]